MLSPTPLRMRLQATIAVAASLVLWWRFGGLRWAALSGLLSALALLAWISPPHFAPIQRQLDRLARGLAVGVSWFLLGIIYFAIFTPLRVISGLLGRDPWRETCSHVEGKTSYLYPLPPAAKDRFHRQY